MKSIQLFSMLMAGVLSAGTLFAQDAASGMGCCGMMPGMGMMGMNKEEMMQRHQKMMEKYKAHDAEINKLVADMNAASGDKKVEAIAAIINKGMEFRKAWFAEMEACQQKMMERMKTEKPTTGGTTTVTPP